MSEEEEEDPQLASPGNHEIIVIAALRGGKKSHSLPVTSPLSTSWPEIQQQLVTAFDVEKDHVAFTYSIDPEFLARPSLYTFQCFGLTFETDWRAATVTAVSIPERCLYVLVEELRPATDLIASMRRFSVRAETDGGHRGGARPRRFERANSSSTWEFLDADTAGVRQLWKLLPSLKVVPFASLLLWHESMKSDQLNTWFSSIANSVPFQEFEWPTYLDKKRRLVREPELRLRVFYGGVCPELRRTLWRHLLYVFPPKLTWKERYEYLEAQRANYARLKSAWQSTIDEQPPEVQSLLTSIRHDVIRTDRERTSFASASSPNLESLYNILVTYVLSNPEATYVQGMNEFAAVFLEVYSGSGQHCEADAYCCYAAFLRLVPALFDMQGLALKFSHFHALLERYDATLFEHLQRNNCTSLIFCSPWLLVNLKREFCHEDVLLLWEVMWSTLAPPDTYMKKLDDKRRRQLKPCGGGGDSTSSAPDQEELFEHPAREVEGAWLRASQIEDGKPAEMLSSGDLPPAINSLALAEARHAPEEEHAAEAAAEEADDVFMAVSPFNIAISDRIGLQRNYGNLLVLFISVAMVSNSREDLLSTVPSEESLAIHFSQKKGLHDVQAMLTQARHLMEDFIARNDEKFFVEG
eukprot:scpid46893/ scgid16520/ TBC1 domain family member 25